MPKKNTTTVTQDKDGYYRVRIPKAIGDAMDLGGAEVEWNIESGNRVSLKKSNE